MLFDAYISWEDRSEAYFLNTLGLFYKHACLACQELWKFDKI